MNEVERERRISEIQIRLDNASAPYMSGWRSEVVDLLAIVKEAEVERRASSLLGAVPTETIKGAWLDSWRTAMDEGDHPSKDDLYITKQVAWDAFAKKVGIAT